MLAHLYISASLLASLVRAAQNPDNNQVGANGPTSSNPNQAFQERVSIHDNVWFDIKHGGEQFYDNERIGWRLKNDDASAVIHMVPISLHNAFRYSLTLDTSIICLIEWSHTMVCNSIFLPADRG